VTAITTCALLAILFGVVSYCATITKFPTYDEPMHFASGYAYRFYGDFRPDAENPPLWKLWATFPISRGALAVDPSDPGWRDAGAKFPRQSWANESLFLNHPAYGQELINRARFPMMLLGVALIAGSAWWAYRIGGMWAAIGTVLLMGLDPNLLGHGSLVKNDVPMALVMLFVLIATWRAGIRVTWRNAIALAFLCAIAINVKLTAVIVPAIVFLTLVARALMSSEWTVLGRAMKTRTMRLTICLAILLLIGVVTFTVIWGAYLFRFAPSTDPTLTVQAEGYGNTFADRAVMAVRKHRMLPNAFCVGLLRQHFATENTPNFMLGDISIKGWWYYFPFAFIVKTPLSTLAAILLAIILVIRKRRSILKFAEPWALVCLCVPFVLFLAAAMSSVYDHGLRSVFPAYPMLFILVAIVLSRAMRESPKITRWIAIVLCLGLATESLSVFPNFISYFNLAAGGSRGGLELLGDSNLDWCQDTNLLLKWQKSHPGVRIYAALWGPFAPQMLGLDYVPMPGCYAGVPDVAPDPREPGVLAISATLLQGIYTPSPWNGLYAEIRTWKPREVLGGTIYLYDFPNPAMTQPRQ
jgi:hypothetical protein